jgi:hypothetical protein
VAVSWRVVAVLARVVGELTDSRRAPANPYTSALYFQLALRLESMRVSVSRLTQADLVAGGISQELAREVVVAAVAAGAAPLGGRRRGGLAPLIHGIGRPLGAPRGGGQRRGRRRGRRVEQQMHALELLKNPKLAA